VKNAEITLLKRKLREARRRVSATDSSRSASATEDTPKTPRTPRESTETTSEQTSSIPGMGLGASVLGWFSKGAGTN
jgi:hypothetical protein